MASSSFFFANLLHPRGPEFHVSTFDLELELLTARRAARAEVVSLQRPCEVVHPLPHPSGGADVAHAARDAFARTLRSVIHFNLHVAARPRGGWLVAAEDVDAMAEHAPVVRLRPVAGQAYPP